MSDSVENVFGVVEDVSSLPRVSAVLASNGFDYVLICDSNGVSWLPYETYDGTTLAITPAHHEVGMQPVPLDQIPLPWSILARVWEPYLSEVKALLK